MANLMGIQMKNIKHFNGMEGYGLNSSIYLDGKRVGTYDDYGNGASGELNCDDRDIEKKVIDRIKEFYRKHPLIDSMKLFDVEFDKDNLPYTDIDKEDIWYLVDVFFSQLELYSELEKDFKKQTKKYSNFAIIHFDFYGRGPRPRDDTFYIANNQASIDKVQKKMDDVNTSNTYIYFSKLEDFNVA